VVAQFLIAFAATPVFTDAGVTLLGTPSPDGAYVSNVENADLTLRNLATGRTLKLTSAGPKEFAYFSSISRDSRLVAYAWFNAEGFYELRVVPAGGGEPRTVFKNPEAGFVQPCAWTPDNKQILTLLFRKDNVSQIALLPVDGGAVKTVRSLNWVYPKRMDLSPDGGTIVYDSFAPGSTSQRTIYSLPLDGGAEKRLVSKPGNHLFPLYSLDGKRLYYLSDNDLVEMTVETGAERIVERNMGRALPLGITAAGKLFYGVRSGSSDVFLAAVDDIAKTARRASAQFPNRNLAPAFSPDGKRLAYLSRRGSENFGQESRAVVVRSENGETDIPVRMAHIERVRWRHDGKALLLSGSDGRGRGGLFEHDLETNRTVPLAAEPGGPFRGYLAVSTKDGVFYSDGKTLRKQDGAVVYEGREILQVAATAEGAVAVYDKNTVALPAVGRFIVMEGLTELIDGGTRLHAMVRGKLVRPVSGEEFALPGNIQPGTALSPDGKTIAVTAGREKQEIWTADLPKPVE